MIDALQGWLWTLSAAAFFVTAVLALAPPKGAAGKTLRLICALLLLALLLQPLGGWNLQVYAEAVSEQRLQGQRLAKQAAADTALLQRLIIQEETEAYILDKAAELGIDGLRVELCLRQGEEAPFPWQVKLWGRAEPGQRAALSRSLEGELGIPAERQVWDVDDGH